MVRFFLLRLPGPLKFVEPCYQELEIHLSAADIGLDLEAAE